MDNAEELIPDFDEVRGMVEELARVKAKLLALKHELSMLEASVVREAQTNNNYWVGGKPPSMAYCDKVVSTLGNTAEDRDRLNKLRIELAELIEMEELLSGLVTLAKDKLDLYRTICANERKGYL